MKAAQITALTGPADIVIGDLPDLEPRPDRVLIRVRAAGVAFPELLQTRGQYQMKPELPFIPGAEVAGEVISAPVGSGFAAGDRVAALATSGGFAEQAYATPDTTFPLPESMSFELGAALCSNYFTAYFALIQRGRLAAGESVLIHGAAGGVGTASIQMAKAFGAGRVIAVVSTARKGEVARQAGADEVVLVEGFKDAALALGGVDVIVDPVGGDRFTDSLRSLKGGGRILVLGFTGGEIPTVRVNRLLLNNIEVVGVGWGAYLAKHPGYPAEQWSAILPHVISGALKPVIGSVHPLSDAAAALQELDERRAVGKVVLIV